MRQCASVIKVLLLLRTTTYPATMALQSKWRDGAFSILDMAIGALNLAKDVSSITPARAVFGSVSVLLTMIRDSMANERDYVEIGMNCADVCVILDRGLNGRRLDELGQSVLEAIKQFSTTVDAIQKKVVKLGKRNAVVRLLHAKADKDAIAIWRQDLTRVLHIFNTELAMNTHMLVVDIHRNALGQEGAYDQHQSGSSTLSPHSVPLGELPPPAPRTCFGRNELIEKLLGFVDNLEPIALIGAGGVGKTSIALTVLHHNRIKDQFGDHRRFIRCDQFPPSRAHFLARLSQVIGAGVKNPEDLTSLRHFLSSHEIFIVLDNAESILDSQGTDAREIFGIVDELCQFETICLLITSRLATIPRHCKHPEIPALSMEAARDMFYSIHSNGAQSCIIDDLLRRLDFHALSITLLATTACHNMWNYDELAEEWDMQRAQLLRTDYNESLAATIELSLASPTFRQLGADARDLLGVVAFFPQGIDERNLDWIFPTISDRKKLFGKFRVLSLTHRSNDFITMLAPIRDYLCLPDPTSSPLLCAVKDRYFSRLSVNVCPDEPGFEKGQWIKSEDTNVEHLLDVFTGTSMDTNTSDVWDACAQFIRHLYWHKQRPTVLGRKIIGLLDDHPFKFVCLFELSKLFESTGNYAEQEHHLSHVLRLARGQGNDVRVAFTLVWLTETSRKLKLYDKGMRRGKEALEIFERLGDTPGQAASLIRLAALLHSDKRFDAALETASRAMKLLPEQGEELRVCQSHRLLGNIYHAKGEREKSIYHFEAALGISSTFKWHTQLFRVHKHLAELFLDEDEFDHAQTHIEQSKSHAVEGTYDLGFAMTVQSFIWFRQGRLEDARSEALGALEIFEKLEAAEKVGYCRGLLHKIEEARMHGRPGSRVVKTTAALQIFLQECWTCWIDLLSMDIIHQILFVLIITAVCREVETRMAELK